MDNNRDAYIKLRPIFDAFENMRVYEPTASAWMADLRDDGSVMVEFLGLGLSRLYASPQDVVDYFRAEYFLRSTFPVEEDWWPLGYLTDPPEN